MNKFGFNRHEKDPVKLIEWYYNGHVENNSYIFCKMHGGKSIGLVDKVSSKDSTFEKAVILKFNKLDESIDPHRINSMMENTYAQKVSELNIHEIMQQLFPNVDIQVKIDHRYCSKRRHDLRIHRKLNYKSNNNVIFQFDSMLSCVELFPIKDELSAVLKLWTKEIEADINTIESIDKNKIKALRYLFKGENEEYPEHKIFISMNESNIRRVHAVLNRIDLEKVKQVFSEKFDLIEELKELILDTQKTIQDSWNFCTNKYGYMPDGKTLESGFKVSIKGVDLHLTKDYVSFNIVGHNIKNTKDQPILERVLAYIISLGNEHALLQMKLEQKLLGSL